MAKYSNKSTSRRDVIKGAGAGAVTAVLGGSMAFPAPAIAKNRTLDFTLSWLPTGQYAYVTLAKQLFWKKRGLDVSVKRGYGSLTTIQAMNTGKFDVGGAATSTSLLGMFRGLDLKFVATHAYDSTMGLIVPADGPIKTPKDFEGRKIGLVQASGETPFLPTYFKLAGVDQSKIQTVALDSQLIEQALLSGRVDFIVGFGMSSMPNFIMKDFKVRLFPFSGVGLKFYWVNALIRPEFLRKEPQVSADIVAGLLEGQKHALLNPEEAVERHLKEYPEITATTKGKLYTELGVGMINANLVTEETMKHSIGYTDLDKMREQVKLVRKFVAKKEDPSPPPVESFCTNDLIGKVTLTPDEWKTARDKARSYGKILGLKV